VQEHLTAAFDKLGVRVLWMTPHNTNPSDAWIASDGVQLLGGHGYVQEHPVERWYRDLRAAGVMEGALVV